MISSDFVPDENASGANDRQEQDRDLMRRVQENDSAALDELLGIYWEPILGYVRRLLVSVDCAEDVAQEAFIELWQNRQRWQGGTVRAYIYRTARNLALNELRHRAVHTRWADRIRSQPEAHAPVIPDDALEGQELERAVNAALAQLPARRREVFILVRYQGMSYRHAAEVMGTSVQTVANQMTIALTELRSLLDAYTPEPARPPLRLLQGTPGSRSRTTVPRSHGFSG